MEFTVLVDAELLEFADDPDLGMGRRRHLLSTANDFEDGAWRYDKFENFIWDNVAQTALTERERRALSEQPQSLLVAAAKNLRLTDSADDVGSGSELAEIALYGVLRDKYGALPVVPKIFHKQNAQDNAKGADSVHIVVDETGDFTLWFGEAKFYNSIEDARLSRIVASVRNSLDSGKLRKENAIIVALSELRELDIDASTCDRIISALSNKNSIDSLKHRIHVPILLLHECAETAKAVEFTAEYRRAIEAHHKERATAYFLKQTQELHDVFKIDEITFHLILFPVPEKRSIIDKFLTTVEFFKG